MRLILIIIAVALLASSPGASAQTLRRTLALFESGATVSTRSSADLLRGASGEVSRYQIMPAVWRKYSDSRDYTNPEIAWSVAEHILADRVALFRSHTGRLPNSQELYLLWNKPGHFEAAGFKVSRVRILYRDRAQRFANLETSLTLRAKAG